MIGGISWPLASLVVICAALVAAAVWYERSRPSSRMVAMIAALAALAIAGRIVAPVIPNVQGTTDVTLLAGYVLGAGPGFAIGAIAALGSNVFLGQGPWTPWEMLGWGMVGVGGALLGRLGGRGLGRLPLALACALAGFVYGAWMDVSVMMNFSGQQTGESYLVIASTSLPFNLAHAIGNFVLALAFGPAFVRLLMRFRSRLSITWSAAPPRPAKAVPAALALIVLGVLAFALSPALAAQSQKGGAGKAVSYLRSMQKGDGGFAAAPGQSSSQLMTGWAVLGLEAAGRNPHDLQRNGKSPIDYMRSGAKQLNDAAELSRTMLALRAAGTSVRNFAGRDLVSELERRQRADGSFQGQAPTTAFAIMALRAAGRSKGSSSVRRATGWLAAQQNDDGGFSNGDQGGASDVDDSGAGLQGLAAAGRAGTKQAKRAATFLAKAQNGDGGMGQFPKAESNAQSSAWAVQGLVSIGRDPARLRRRGRSLLGYLRSLQQFDGSYRYSRTSSQTPVWVTSQVLAAVSLESFPLERVARQGITAAAAGSSHSPEKGADRVARSKARSRAARRAPAPASRAGLDAPARTVASGLAAAASSSGRASANTGSDGSSGLLALGLACVAVAALGGGLWLVRRRA